MVGSVAVQAVFLGHITVQTREDLCAHQDAARMRRH